MSDAGGEALQIYVHPMAVMGMADHYIRDFQQYRKKRVVGAVFGSQDGRDLHAMEVLGIPYNEQATNPGMEALDVANFAQELSIFKQAYPMELIGWYSTGSQIQPGDSEIHAYFHKYSERPLFFLLSTEVTDPKDIGLRIFVETVTSSTSTSSSPSSSPLSSPQSSFSTSSSSSSSSSKSSSKSSNAGSFTQLAFKVAQDDAERVTVMHGADLSARGGNGNGSASNLSALGALQSQVDLVDKAGVILRDQVKIILQFLTDVKNGRATASHDLLRKIKGLVARLPSASDIATQGAGLGFNEAMQAEMGDVLLATYMATTAKIANGVKKLKQ